jgi:hypothetical protein
MDALIIDPREVRETGFRALSGAIGWVNAVRFLRQLDPGSGNYAEERQTILPEWDAETLLEKAGELQAPHGPAPLSGP